MFFNYLYFFILLLFGCQSNNIEMYIKKSNEYRLNKDYISAVIELKKAEKNNTKNKNIDKINFLLGEIYLNDIKDYNYAIHEFKKIHEKSIFYPKAIFMIAYIYSNNLNEFSQAIKHYDLFLENFPKHELYASVEYEMNLLSNHIEIIDSLNIIANTRKEQ